MELLHSLILFLCLSVGAFSAPTAPSPQQKGVSFQVERVKRGDYVAHGPTALRKTYQKYGIALPNFNGIDLDDFEPFERKHRKPAASNQDATAGSEQTGTVSATSVQSDAEFVSPVTIGGQNVSMDFDTGSADMWVMNTQLPAFLRQDRAVFDPKESKTFKEIQGGEFNISYGDSSYAYGTVGQDTVSIGGATVTDQVFGLPVGVSESFMEDASSSGIVGLGFSFTDSIQPGPQKTFFDNVAGSLEEPVLTARLRSDGVGEYEFGKVDHSKYQGTLVTVDVDPSNGYWQFETGQFAVGNGALQTISQTPTAIADTGTSLMLVSPEIADAYYKQVSGAVFSGGLGGYIYPCNAALPNLSVALGDKFKATVPGSLINFSQAGTNKTTGETVCYGGVQPNQGSDLQVFGDVFLKSLFVVFNQQGPSLGFASPT